MIGRLRRFLSCRWRRLLLFVVNPRRCNREYDEAELWHEPSTSPCLNVLEHLFSRLGVAVDSVLLAAADILQHIQSVHDLFGVGGVWQSLDGIQGFLLSGMRLHV